MNTPTAPKWTGPDGWPTSDYFRCVATEIERRLRFTFDEDPATWSEALDTEVEGSSWEQHEPWDVVYTIPPHLYAPDRGRAWPLGVVLGWRADEPMTDDEAPEGRGWHWGPLNPEQPGWATYVDNLPTTTLIPEPDHVADMFVNALHGNTTRYEHAVSIVADTYQPITARGFLASIVGETDPDAPEARPWLFARCAACGWEIGFGPSADPTDLAQAAEHHVNVDGDEWAARRDRLTHETTQ